MKILSLQSAQTSLSQPTAGTAFQNLSWLAETPQSRDIQIAIVNDSLAIPYYIESWYGIRILRIAGSKAGDYQDLLYLKGMDSSRQGDLAVALHDIAKKTPFDVFFAERSPTTHGLPHFPYWESSHQLLLEKSFEDLYAKKIPSKIRNDSARQIRRLEELGKLHFSVAQSEAEAMSWLEKTVLLKNKHYERLQVPSIFAEEKYLDFYRNLTQKHWCSSTLHVHVSALELNGEVLSVHWGLVHQKRFYYMLPAYRADEFAKYSPGRIHLQYLIRWACENDLDVFDFTIGDEGYKAQWCDQEMPLYQVYSVMSLKGHFFLIKEKIRHFLKKSKRMNAWILKLLAKVRA